MNLVLLGALLVQVALTAILWWPRHTAQAVEPLLADVAATDVSSFVVTDDAGHEVELARSGDGWVIPNADSYPADSAKIDEAITKLIGLTRGNAVTETAASHARMKVADSAFARRVELRLSEGGTRTLYIGSSSSYGEGYARLAGEDAVYRARGLSTYEWSATASGWIDTLYVDIALAEVSALQVVNKNATLQLTRLDNGGWSLAGQPPDYKLSDAAVNTLAQRATSLRMTAPLGKELLPAYGLDVPLATVTITTAKGDTVLLVGAKQADGSYAIKSSANEYVVSVSSYTVEGLLNASADTLRQPDVTPTPLAPASQ